MLFSEESNKPCLAGEVWYELRHHSPLWWPGVPTYRGPHPKILRWMRIQSLAQEKRGCLFSAMKPIGDGGMSTSYRWCACHNSLQELKRKTWCVTRYHIPRWYIFQLKWDEMRSQNRWAMYVVIWYSAQSPCRWAWRTFALPVTANIWSKGSQSGKAIVNEDDVDAVRIPTSLRQQERLMPTLAGMLFCISTRGIS